MLILDFHLAALEMAAGSGVESQEINGDYAGNHESYPGLEREALGSYHDV